MNLPLTDRPAEDHVVGPPRPRQRPRPPLDLARVAASIMYLGTGVVVLGLGKWHARFVAGYDFSQSARFAWALAYIALLALAAYAVGLPDIVRPGHLLVRSLGAVTAATLVISACQLLLGSAVLPRLVTVLAPVALVPGYVVCGRLARRPSGAGHAAVAVLESVDGDLLRRDLAGSHRPGLPQLAAVVPPDEAAAGGGLLAAALGSSAAVLVMSPEALANQHVLEQAAALHARGVRVRSLEAFYDEVLAMVPSQEASRASLLFDIGEVHGVAYDRLKRALDAVVGLAGLLVLALLTPLVVAANRIANRGPLLYRQPRVGREGTVFEMYKFRTMSAGAAHGPWTTAHDARVTPFGRWLRRTHLDELPQMVNILRGDLATVGPRPEQPQYVALLRASIPFYDVRHLVRPGLTGWAQVNRPYGASTGDALDKLRYDLYYLRHQSLLFDVRILVRTLRDVVGGTGS